MTFGKIPKRSRNTQNENERKRIINYIKLKTALSCFFKNNKPISNEVIIT